MGFKFSIGCEHKSMGKVMLKYHFADPKAMGLIFILNIYVQPNPVGLHSVIQHCSYSKI